MNFPPTLSSYIESIANPAAMFRTLGNPVCERDAYGRPRMFAGGNAAIFKINTGGKQYSLKCYIRRQKRSQLICGYIADIDSSLLCKTLFLPEEMYVLGSNGTGGWYGVALAEWVQGRTLEFEIRKAIRHSDKNRLALLAAEFDILAMELLRAEWAHGDLKPENIIVEPNGGMRLIDYDAMYIPAFKGMDAEEIGTPMYQHPIRGTGYFNEHIDDYPVALISATLHLLAADPEMGCRFGNADFFLFSPTGILGGKSKGYAHALDTASKSCDAPLYNLLLRLTSPTPQIDGLIDIIKVVRKNHEACIATTWQDITPFRKGAKWGYLGQGGHVFVPPLYDNALEFSEGLAAVKLGTYNHYIDASGKCIVNCSEYEAVKSFSEGFAAVKKDGLWGYINRKGEETVAPQYIKAWSVKNGTAKIIATNGESHISF